MEPLAIKARNLDVDFEVFSDRRASLKSRFIERGATGRSTVSALRDVSFDVREGETVGVVGLNGSGKSTLLSAVAGVLPLTNGELLVSDEPRPWVSELLTR